MAGREMRRPGRFSTPRCRIGGAPFVGLVARMERSANAGTFRPDPGFRCASSGLQGKGETLMQPPEIVSHEEWLAAREAHLKFVGRAKARRATPAKATFD